MKHIKILYAYTCVVIFALSCTGTLLTKKIHQQILQGAHQIENKAVDHAQHARHLRTMAHDTDPGPTKTEIEHMAKAHEAVSSEHSQKAHLAHKAVEKSQKQALREGHILLHKQPHVRYTIHASSSPEDHAKALLATAHDQLAVGMHKKSLLDHAKELETNAKIHLDPNPPLANELYYHSGRLRDKYMALDEHEASVREKAQEAFQKLKNLLQ